MAEEEDVVAASPAPSDHKRKLKDLEPQETPEMVDDLNSNPKPNSDSDSVKKTDEEEAVTDGPLEAKRPRSDTLATENGYQMEKLDELNKEDNQQSTVENNTQSEDAQPVANEDPETVKNEQPSTEDNQTEEAQQHTVENAEQEASGEKLQEPCAEVTQQVDASSADQQPESETQIVSRKMEVPNNKVGVLIGKYGDIIRFLQFNSGAKILITRDFDVDPGSATRTVELIGTLENINKAEKLIMEVIAEADAGGFSTSQFAGAAEQLQIQVPIEKLGLIIGKAGETIKNLQMRSGARIQLIPQNLPEGDNWKERTVRMTGDKKQIEIAREMIKDVMNQSAYTTISLCKALKVERLNGHKAESLEGKVKLLTKSLAEKQKALGYFEQRALEAEEKAAELEAMLQVCKSGGLEMYQRFLKIPTLKFADGFRYGFEQGGKPEAERDYKDPDDFDAHQAIDSFGEYDIPMSGEAERKFVDFLKGSCSALPSTSVVAPFAPPPPDQIRLEVSAPAKKGTSIVDSFDQDFSKEDGAAP